MKRIFVLTVFLLAAMAWAVAQTGAMPQQSGGQATPPSSQAPGAPQTQPTTPGSTGQTAPEAGTGAQAGAQTGATGGAINAPITEGCLGGSNPNFTITDTNGTTYKLVIPPNADASSLNAHVGESVQVMGDVNHAAGANAINVSRIGRGTSKCPASGQGTAQRPPSK